MSKEFLCRACGYISLWNGAIGNCPKCGATLSSQVSPIPLDTAPYNSLQTFQFTFEELEALLKDLSEDYIEENIPFTLFSDGRIKCGGCGWGCDRLYVHADDREEAIKLLKSGYDGMCGECYAEMLADNA